MDSNPTTPPSEVFEVRHHLIPIVHEPPQNEPDIAIVPEPPPPVGLDIPPVGAEHEPAAPVAPDIPPLEPVIPVVQADGGFESDEDFDWNAAYDYVFLEEYPPPEDYMTPEDDVHDVNHTPEWAVGYESDLGAEYEEPYEPKLNKPVLPFTYPGGERIRAEWEGIGYTEEQWAFYAKYGYRMPSATVGCSAGCRGYCMH